MPWSDYDYLQEALDDARQQISQIAREREMAVTDDGAYTPALEQLLAVEDRLFQGGDIAFVQQLATDILALPEEVMPPSTGLIINLTLSEAVRKEIKNNDESECPWAPSP
jgi:hypothetical protein